MEFNVPMVGVEGTWVLKTPYNTLLPLNTPLTCTGVDNYGLLVKRGVNVKQTYYEKYNLDDATYKKHSSEVGKIIFVKSSLGTIYSFPLHYLESFPIGTGVGYCSHGIGVRLMALPIDQPLDTLIQQVTDLVKLTLGVDAQIETMVLSEPTYITHAQHKKLQEGRDAIIEENTPALKLVYELKETNTTLVQKLTIAEAQVIAQDARIKELEKQLAEKP